MFDLNSSLHRLQGMSCSEYSKSEKTKSFEEMSSDASMEKEKQCHKFSQFPPSVLFNDVKLGAELSSKIMESKRKYFSI